MAAGVRCVRLRVEAWCRRASDRSRWGLRSVLAVVVVLAVTASTALPAAAAGGIPDGQPDSAGNYAQCNVNFYSAAPGTATAKTDDGSSVVSSFPNLAPYVWFVYPDVACQATYPVGSAGASQMSVAVAGTQFGISRGAAYATPTTGFYEFLSSELGSSGVSCVDSAGAATLAADGYASSFVSSCATAPVSCNYDYKPCEVYSSTAVASLSDLSVPSLPPDYWVGETVVLPAPAAPVVTCSAQVNPISGVAQLSATATSVSGASVAYSWVPGDGSAALSGLDVVHTYSGGAMPPGGFVAVFTATATGDGVTTQGSATASCSAVVNLIAGDIGGASGLGPTGGLSLPTSCSWFDVVCSLESFVGTWFVPGPTFFQDWSSFVTAVEGSVPFGYVFQAASWASTFVSTAFNPQNTPTCVSFLPKSGPVSVSDTCVTVPSVLSDLVQGIVGAALVFGLGLELWRAGRRIVQAH